MSTPISRRVMLKKMSNGSMALVACASGLLPMQILAEWPASAFEESDIQTALELLFGEGAEMTESDNIKIKAPDIAENGAVVPVSASVDMENVETIAFFVSENPNPLAASFDIGASAMPDVSTRLKMGKTGNFLVVAKADGKLYSVEKEIKVTIGGCGG